jgi:hypothetical protein
MRFRHTQINGRWGCPLECSITFNVTSGLNEAEDDRRDEEHAEQPENEDDGEAEGGGAGIELSGGVAMLFEDGVWDEAAGDEKAEGEKEQVIEEAENGDEV